MRRLAKDPVGMVMALGWLLIAVFSRWPAWVQLLFAMAVIGVVALIEAFVPVVRARRRAQRSEPELGEAALHSRSSRRP